jgi:mannose/fructose-specific phosphotransferase system component IIA
MVKIILISHGTMAQALLETASQIASFDKSTVDAFSVSGKGDLESLPSKIMKAQGQNGTLILVDTLGGSSCNTAVQSTQHLQNIKVICGVNLNMLLSAINNRDKMDIISLARKVLEDGKKSLIDISDKLK